jgi:hypothetical protein
VLGTGEYRCCARDQRARILQIGSVVGRAAHLAVVAVLVIAAAAWALSLHEPVREKQSALRVEQLLHVAREDVAAFEQTVVDALAQPSVLFGVRRIEVVVGDEEALEVALVLDADLFDQLLGRYAELLRFQHRCGAVRIVGTNVDALITAQALKAHPDIGLDVFEQMPEMDGSIRVRQRAGDQYFAGRGHR